MNYNLLEEEWIPVLWRDGRTSRVGIIDALTKAGQIRQIAASNSMDRVAILRFLLALLYWCKGNPPEEIPEDSFPPDWFTRLNDNKECFNLLGEGKRFYQCKPKIGKDKKHTANYLVQEVPTGKNFWHFRHSIDKSNGLCPACCGMGLLRVPLFATSGGRGKPPGINGKPPIYIVPLGSSLAHTLRLLWWPISDLDFGTPAWERPDLQLPRQGKVPLLTGLTWLPRRVWLDDPQGIKSHCISCGREEHLILQCVFAGIGSTKTDDDDQGRVWSDPHIIYDRKNNVVRPGNVLDASDAAAGWWAKIMAGILREQKVKSKITLWIVGFATVKNDKYLEAVEYMIPFPSAPEEVQENIEMLEEWQKEGTKLAPNLVREMKKLEESSQRKHIEVLPMVNSIRPHVENRVSAKASELITGGDEVWEKAASEYGPMMDAVAKSLCPGYTTVALQMRKKIAGAKPNIVAKNKGAKKPVQKKGGDE